MKFKYSLLPFLGLLSLNLHADPVRCDEYVESNFLYKKTTEECSFKYMYGNNQMSTSIPTRYNNKPLNRGTACGPTAIATIYRHIFFNKDYYKPKENSFFSQIADKDIYSVIIPELYFKMKTRYNYGTLPLHIYSEGLSAKYFDDSFTEFYSFFESNVFNFPSERYYDRVKRRNPMAILVGYIQPSCVNVLGITKCSLMVPETLHYEALAGATKKKSLFNKYSIQLWDGNDTWSPESTDLVQVQEGCKRSATYSYCSETTFNLSFSLKKGFDYKLCKTWSSRQICELDYIFPVGINKAMRFTSDDTNVENTNAKWTLMLGYFGLTKK
jgi:hypothetical protein